MRLEWDSITFVVYIALSVYFYHTTQAIIISKTNKGKKVFLACIIPILFATFRFVSYPVGGRDAQAYINDFVNAEYRSNSIIDAFLLKSDSNPLFDLLVYLVRGVTSDYHVLFLLIYGFIVISLYMFLVEFFKERSVYIPIVYVGYYFLMSFNIIRFMFGLAFIQLAYVLIKKQKNIVAFILFLCGALCHISLLILPVLFFLYILINRMKKMRTSLIIIGIIVANVAFIVLKDYASSYIAGTSYSAYADYVSNIMASFSSLVCGLLTIIFYKDMRQDNSVDMFMVYCALADFALIPAMSYIGFFRLHIVFVLPRLYIWSVVLENLNKRVVIRPRWAYSFLMSTIFISWTIFRFIRDWYNAGLMPYIFSLF